MPGEVRLRDRAIAGQSVELDAAAVPVSDAIEQAPQPGAPEALRLQEALHELPVLQREPRQRPGLTGELLRVFEGALEDEPGHRVDVHGHHLAPETHRFQGNGTAAGEGVQHLGCLPTVRLADLGAKPLQVRAALPPPVEDAAVRLLLHPLDHAAVHALALGPLDEAAGHALQDLLALTGFAGIGKEGRDQRGPAGGQRSARRPDVQGGDVPVAHVLLVHGVEGDLLQREGGLDEALLALPLTHPYALQLSDIESEGGLPAGHRRVAHKNLAYRIGELHSNRLSVPCLTGVVVQFRQTENVTCHINNIRLSMLDIDLERHRRFPSIVRSETWLEPGPEQISPSW